MIIGICGFSWSGSSAVADFLAEFNENQVYNESEFLLAFYPDGIEDLDYNLNTKCSKFLSSTVAVPRFRKIAKMLLDGKTHGKIGQLTDDYLNNIIQVKWLGTGQGQELLFDKRIYNLAMRALRRLSEPIARKYKVPPLRMMEYAIRPERFVEATKDYTDNILREIGLDMSKNIVLDQPFAGNNPIHCMQYFRNSKAIIVDRDPRDLYLMAKVYYPTRTYACPHEKVDDFISFFYHMHKDLKRVAEHPDVLCIKFEELVYEYELTTKRIIEFLGLGNHVFPKKYFRPERSMANTRLFEKNSEYTDDIREIERNLAEFIFDFDRYKDMKAEGGMFDENPPIDWRKS